MLILSGCTGVFPPDPASLEYRATDLFWDNDTRGTYVNYDTVETPRGGTGVEVTELGYRLYLTQEADTWEVETGPSHDLSESVALWEKSLDDVDGLVVDGITLLPGTFSVGDDFDSGRVLEVDVTDGQPTRVTVEIFEGPFAGEMRHCPDLPHELVYEGLDWGYGKGGPL